MLQDMFLIVSTFLVCFFNYLMMFLYIQFKDTYALIQDKDSTSAGDDIKIIKEKILSIVPTVVNYAPILGKDLYGLGQVLISDMIVPDKTLEIKKFCAKIFSTPDKINELETSECFIRSLMNCQEKKL